MTPGIPNLGPAERRLLLNCSRVEMTAGQVAESEAALHKYLDWGAILFFARLHSVAPLLHHHLRRLDGYVQIPSDARHRLLQLYHRADYQNRLYARENGALLEAFNQAHIRTIVPKGLTLLELVYKSLGLRPLIDLIFLIPSNKVKLVRELLVDRGYVQKRPCPVDGIYRWSCPQLIYNSFRGLNIDVLLLWDLVNWPRLHRFSPPLLWQRAEPGRLSGSKTLFLSPEDLVLYLCLQLDNHGYFNRVAVHWVEPAQLLFAGWSNNRVIRFTDLYEVIRHYGDVIDWTLLVERAKTSGLQEAVYTSLFLTDSLLGPTVAPLIVEELRPASRHGLRRWVLEAVASESGGHRRSAAQRTVGSFWRARQPGSHIRLARLIGLLEYAFPDSQTVRLRYRIRSNAGLLPLYLFHGGRAFFRSVTSFLTHSLARLPDRLKQGGDHSRVRTLGRS